VLRSTRHPEMIRADSVIDPTEDSFVGEVREGALSADNMLFQVSKMCQIVNHKIMSVERL
jgi:hypothetical protein